MALGGDSKQLFENVMEVLDKIVSPLIGYVLLVGMMSYATIDFMPSAIF